MTQDARDQLLAALADRYAIEREIGAGGMATVYLARDLKHDREVALKVLRPELGAVLGAERFLAEIRITARLDHPHILTLIDSGASGGLLYYVLPFVRGESLRDKITREKQLSVEEAVRIARQIASALDYAHKHGVVHRDIKPENILLHEGEAMLADFGIALGVKEAGGNRLTETGLSLGTPQYMSPEQATGDRAVDARSDEYSLAAVLYEMLAGEPPVTGPTAQAMIAKLMTERPTRLRVVRASVPPEVEDAVAKALDKTPADRFASAADFARAIEHHTPMTGGHPSADAASAPRSVRRPIALAAAAIIVAGLAAAGYAKFRHRGAEWVLKDRSQLTFTGNVVYSAISQDGKQLAYWTRRCKGAECTYGVSVQDMGGTTSRQIFDGAIAAFGIEWSPDRRNLMIAGVINGRSGSFLLSALGGPPRFLTSGFATFWAGGDSLLIAPPYGAGDSVHYVRVASLDGSVADSIRVVGAGLGIDGLSVQPGGQYIVALIIQKGRGFWQVLDRQGKVSDHVTNSCTCPGIISAKALFLQRLGAGFESIVRVGLDPASGRLASHQDTLYSGSLNGFSVSADGGTLVLDDGATDYSLYALDLQDALRGKFPDAKRVLRASSAVGVDLSPDGRLLLISRTVTTSAGKIERHFFVSEFDGSGERPLGGPVPRRAYWADADSVVVVTESPTGLHVALVNARTQAVGRTIDLADSLARQIQPFQGGWLWVSSSRDKLTIDRGGKRTEVPKPKEAASIIDVATDTSGARLAMTTWPRTSTDTIDVYAGAFGDAALARWASFASGPAFVQFGTDGSIIVASYSTEDNISLYRLRTAGKLESLGTVDRPVSGVAISRDLKRAAVTAIDYHGDTWLSKVVRP
jgi:hypothetical protein